MENSGHAEPKPDKKLSRRKLLGGAVAGLAAAALSGFALYEKRRHEETEVSPEYLPQEPEFLGFNTALYAETQGEDDLSLQAFIEDIDSMSKEGQNMVRFVIRDWEIAPTGTTTEIDWQETQLNVYDEAIQYATQKGIDVYLASSTPEFASSFSDTDYTETSKDYFSFLAKRYQGKLKALQLFNEPNIHSYKNYSQAPSDADTLKFANLITEVARDVKKVDPEIEVTVNVGGWPLNDETIQDWKTFYQQIAPSIDFLSLDLYPGTDEASINHLGTWVQELKDAFHKNIFVSELGMSTAQVSETDQARYLSQAITVLKQAGVSGILLYQYRDSARSAGFEGHFGIKNADGSKKSSYDEIVSTMEITPTPDTTNQPQNK